MPSYLQPGDTIGMVCPAGFMAAEKVATCVLNLEEWGYQVKLGTTIGGNSQTYFSGTDDERRADFQAMLDDDSVKAILCGRGGYGTGKIIDDLDFTKFQQNPKWIIGYSDITVFHTHITRNFGVATLHSPMAAAFNEGGFANEYVQSLRQALAGEKANYHCGGHAFNQTGVANGELIGGNLSLLAHVIGTASDFDTKEKILFIEDVGEYIYSVDRMMRQLKRCGKFNHLAGLIIGGFSEMKDTDRPYGLETYEVINDLVKEFNYPICFDFPVSHTDRNYALKVGADYTLSVGKEDVSLKEQ